jgi:hypothetical protein
MNRRMEKPLWVHFGGDGLGARSLVLTMIPFCSQSSKPFLEEVELQQPYACQLESWKIQHWDPLMSHRLTHHSGSWSRSGSQGLVNHLQS